VEYRNTILKEANELWSIRKALIFSTVLQATQIAWADNTTPESPVAPPLPSGAVRALPHIDYVNFRLLKETERQRVEEPIFHFEGGENNGQTAPTEIDRPKGFTWTLQAPHPGLEYKFSNTGAIHFHAAAHGAAASAAWKF